jgi:hypothetical protein
MAPLENTIERKKTKKFFYLRLYIFCFKNRIGLLMLTNGVPSSFYFLYFFGFPIGKKKKIFINIHPSIHWALLANRVVNLLFSIRSSSSSRIYYYFSLYNKKYIYKSSFFLYFFIFFFSSWSFCRRFIIDTFLIFLLIFAGIFILSLII